MLRREDFVGTWRLRRKIVDHLSGQEGHLQGEAVLTPDGDRRLIYDESGTLVLAHGTEMVATRRYLWDFVGQQVVVTFEDGRPFHQFMPAGDVDGTDHPCGDDFYTVQYHFTTWPIWEAVWTVNGPRKDYVSRSDYAPIALR
ncbi:DUF6314 family protein [Yoonia sp.]|uniref:DUF6314 family protein n=1 Tax=Yoonia sp. TaxID=2212373 RepID=UPI0035C81297